MSGPSFFDVELPESALAPDSDAVGTTALPFVGADAERLTPPRTLVNATTTEQYTGTVWRIYRPGATQHEQYKSRGF